MNNYLDIIHIYLDIYYFYDCIYMYLISTCAS